MKLLTRIIVFVFFPACFVVFQYCEKKSLPSVTTLPVSGITHVNANSGGKVTNNGGAEVTSRGICWNTTESPTITCSKTTDGAGNGAFTSSMSGLVESTTYFVRAYATNSEGTSYGQQVSFSTLIKPPEADFSATPPRVSAGESVQFNDLSANSPSAWSWNFGDGTTSTEKNPLHVYSNEGTYTVSLTVTNASGSNTRTKENYITVDPAVKVPVADFIFSKDKIKAGETVQFTDKSLNAPAGWKWNFGDDSTSTLQNPVHKYSSAGVFTVSLVATNSAGSNTKSIPNCITVEPQVPIADFTASLTIVTVGQAVQFTDQSVNSPASWTWDFGDGSSSAVQNPGHAYTNPGKYTVSLTVSNASGSNVKTKDNYITVNPEVKIPVADFIYSKSKIKTGETVQFTDKSLNAPASWKWNFGDDSTSTLQNPVHKFSSAGLFTVSLVATNSAGSNTKTIPNCITVEPQVPVAAFTASLTIVPVGQTVQFTDQSENSPVSWTWDFGDGSSSAMKNPSHAYANSGKYTVSLIVTNVSGSDTETKTDYITAGLPPNAGFTVSQANPKVNQSVTFTDQSTNAPLKWSWDFGDKLTSQVQNPDHAYTATGKYTVSLTVTNPFGSDTETKTDYIDVMPLPPVADFIAVPTSIFEGERIQFTDKSLNNPTSWSWNFGDASQDTRQNPLHGYSEIGIYNPSLTVSNNSGRDTKTRNNYIFVSRKIEAETADTIKTGTIDSNDPGFTGTGFVNLENRQGTYAVWKINLRGGHYNLEIRYANGSTERAMDVYVNNVLRINNLVFPTTGSWSTWTTLTIAIDLSIGNNYLKLVGDNPDSGPSLDSFVLTPVVRK